MPIYDHPAWIYFNDTEYFELLSNLGHRELLKIARARGYIFSEKTDDSVVRASLSLLPSNWPVVNQIYGLIARPDPAERKSALHVHGCDEKNDVAAIAKTIRDERAEKYEERYTINQESPEITRVVVSYTETDLTKALQYSRRRREIEIEIVKKGNDISFFHDATDRARLIVKTLKRKLQPAIEGESVKEEVISLKTIRDPALRTRFFTELIKGIAGQSFRSASHVLVDRRLPNDEIPENSPAGGSDKKSRAQAKKIKSIINKMALTGEQVLGDTFYQQVSESGYFITQINWTTEDKTAPGKFVDYVAGFGEPISCDHFSSDVIRRWQWNADNPDKSESVPISVSDRRSLNALIQSGADKAFATVTKEMQAKKSKN